jgi:hypothetical protein
VPLSSANESPAITNADAGSTGTATIALTVTKDDAGTVTSATANFQISVRGFPPGTTVTDAHIHNGAAGSNAGVYVNTALASGEMAIGNGSGSITKNGINVPADRAAAILSNPAGHYFNVQRRSIQPGDTRPARGGGATFDPGTRSMLGRRPLASMARSTAGRPSTRLGDVVGRRSVTALIVCLASSGP